MQPMRTMFRNLLLFLFTLPLLAQAADGATKSTGVNPLDSLRNVGKNLGYGEPREVEFIIADIVRVLISFLGIIFVIFIIWSGFQWMTAGGNEKRIEEAKNRIKNATIGLVIVLAAYSIAYWITLWLETAVTGPGGDDTTGTP